MNVDEIFLTKEGYKNLKKELEYLKKEKRNKITENVQSSLTYGDLFDNFEYYEAKNEQFENEARILELETILQNVKIINKSKLDTKTVKLGNKIKILDMEYKEELIYTLVEPIEVDINKNKISNKSPLGLPLIGAKINQIIKAITPSGIIKYKVLEIS